MLSNVNKIMFTFTTTFGTCDKRNKGIYYSYKYMRRTWVEVSLSSRRVQDSRVNFHSLNTEFRLHVSFEPFVTFSPLACTSKHLFLKLDIFIGNLTAVLFVISLIVHEYWHDIASICFSSHADFWSKNIALIMVYK